MIALPCRKPYSPVTYLYSQYSKLALPQCWAKPMLRIDEYVTVSLLGIDDMIYNEFRSSCFSRCTDRHESYCMELLSSCIGDDRACEFQHYWPLDKNSNQYSWPCGCIQPLGRDLATGISLVDPYLQTKAWVTIDDKPYRYIATCLSNKKRKAERRHGRKLIKIDRKRYRDGRRR